METVTCPTCGSSEPAIPYIVDLKNGRDVLCDDSFHTESCERIGHDPRFSVDAGGELTGMTCARCSARWEVQRLE